MHGLQAARLRRNSVAAPDRFERDGFLIVENALTADMVADLLPLVDEIDRDERKRSNADPDARMNHYDVIGRDPRLLELIEG